ncbi:MAG: pyruvate formate-lyase-activating protein [Oscillospiraceae bacterium]|nr:pyruvate formate-lyase-activating protein [Oscillospiraceae bacterium]
MENEKKPAIGYINKLETFGLVDGPGVRFVVFVQGCDMRCKYCHNPETWHNSDETIMQFTGAQLFKRAYRYKTYWRDNGGITVSGGEPLLQIDFLIDFFKEAKKKGVHTTLDTSGNPFTMEEPFFSKFQELMKVTDLVMLDIKHTDPAAHRELCGQDNANILQLAQYLSDTGKEMWIRRVLVPGISNDDEELKHLKQFIDGLKTVTRVEVLPYHTLGTAKWEKLGVPYPLEGVEPPTFDEIERAEAILGIPSQPRPKDPGISQEHLDRLMKGCN